MAIEKKSGHGSRHVRDLMTANPACVKEKDSILEAARIMKKEDTGVVPVVDGNHIIGMITDRDIVVRLVAEGKDLGKALVNEAMSKNVRKVREDATVDDVLNTMKGADVRRLPVVNERDEIVGIVSMGDISSANQDGKVGQAIQDISEARPNN